jgi:hypothetical protein
MHFLLKLLLLLFVHFVQAKISCVLNFIKCLVTQNYIKLLNQMNLIKLKL